MASTAYQYHHGKKHTKGAMKIGKQNPILFLEDMCECLFDPFYSVLFQFKSLFHTEARMPYGQNHHNIFVASQPTKSFDRSFFAMYNAMVLTS